MWNTRNLWVLYYHCEEFCVSSVQTMKESPLRLPVSGEGPSGIPVGFSGDPVQDRGRGRPEWVSWDFMEMLGLS